MHTPKTTAEMTVRSSWQTWVAQLRHDTYALYLASRDSRVPWPAKIVAVLVVAYLLSPLDLIPDFIPVLGYLDDIVLVPLGIALAIRCIPADIWANCKERAADRLTSDLPRSWTAVIVIAAMWAGVLVVLVVIGLRVFDDGAVSPSAPLMQPDR